MKSEHIKSIISLATSFFFIYLVKMPMHKIWVQYMDEYHNDTSI